MTLPPTAADTLAEAMHGYTAAKALDADGKLVVAVHMQLTTPTAATLLDLPDVELPPNLRDAAVPITNTTSPATSTATAASPAAANTNAGGGQRSVQRFKSSVKLTVDMIDGATLRPVLEWTGRYPTVADLMRFGLTRGFTSMTGQNRPQLLEQVKTCA